MKAIVDAPLIDGPVPQLLAERSGLMILLGCLVALASIVAPRVLLALAWMVADRWALVWNGEIVIPLLGIVFLPYTTIMYVLVWTPNGIAGFAWMWLLLGVLLDLMQWTLWRTNRQTGSSYINRYVVPSAHRLVASIRTITEDSRAPVVVIVVLMATYALLISSRLHLVDYDEAIFLDSARSIRSGGLPVRSIAPDGVLFFDHTPLYSYILAPISWAGDVPARLLSVLFGVGTVLLVAGTVRGPGGWVAGAIVAFSPFLIRQSTSIYMEAALVFFIALSIYAVSRDRFGWAALAAALAVLTKEIALIYVAVAALYLVTTRSWRDAAKFVVVPAVAFIGWLLWAYMIDATRFSEVMSRWLRSTSGAANDPRVLTTPQEWAEHIVLLIFSPVGLVLIVVALMAALRRRPPTLTLLPTLYIVAAVGISFAVGLKEPRHLIAVIPAIALVVGLAVPWAPGRALLAVTLTMLVSTPLILARSLERYEEQEVLAQIRSHALASNDGVVAGPIAGWYSGKQYWIGPPP